MKCLNCGIEFESKRTDAKYCSPNCKLKAFRRQSIETDNIAFRETDNETDNFEFTVTLSDYDKEANQKVQKESVVRVAKYWYDVPLAAHPKVKKGWPEVPVFPAIDSQPETIMNGRQYFLWWKNNFETKEDGTPVIHNPFPVRENVQYVQAGEGSRRWGA